MSQYTKVNFRSSFRGKNTFEIPEYWYSSEHPSAIHTDGISIPSEALQIIWETSRISAQALQTVYHCKYRPDSYATTWC